MARAKRKTAKPQIQAKRAPRPELSDQLPESIRMAASLRKLPEAYRQRAIAAALEVEAARAFPGEARVEAERTAGRAQGIRTTLEQTASNAREQKRLATKAKLTQFDAFDSLVLRTKRELERNGRHANAHAIWQCLERYDDDAIIRKPRGYDEDGAQVITWVEPAPRGERLHRVRETSFPSRLSRLLRKDSLR